MRGELRDEILELLRKGPMTRDELRQAAKSCPDPKQVSNALFQLRVGGHVQKMGDHKWAITDGAGAKEKAPSKVRAMTDLIARADRIAQRPTTAAATPTPAAAGTGSLDQILEKAVEDAQGALDAYVSSLGDPEILRPLRAMRDHARTALDNYRKARAA